MTFKFNRLYSLYKSMRSIGTDMEQFRVSVNRITFDCIFKIDCRPYELMIGVHEHNFACLLHINSEYQVNPSEIDYAKLCKILQLTYKKDHFSTYKFLNYIDTQLPASATRNFANPQMVARFKENKLSKSDRAEGYIFCGWLRHKGMNNGHARNIEKTRQLLGEKAAIFCEQNDISSKWTTDSSKRIPITFPTV